MWVVSKTDPGKHIVLYHYSPNRSGSVPVKLLRGFKGYLQTDGYEGYNQIRSQQDVYGVACLAHIRRKFVDAVNAKKKPSKAGICVTGLDYKALQYRETSTRDDLKKTLLCSTEKNNPRQK